METIHEEKTNKPFECGSCDAKYARKINLNVHIAKFHGGKNPYNCGICDVICDSRTTLYMHMESVHEEKKLKCNFCDAKYAPTSRYSLKHHIDKFHNKV